jgi:hypothetical protein
VFPRYEPSPADPFLRRLQASGRKWVVITDAADEPRLVLDSDSYLRAALFSRTVVSPAAYCHTPLVVRDGRQPLGHVLGRLTVYPEHASDDVVDHDLILVWAPDDRRIITGADILGRLLCGIARVVPPGLAPRRSR